MKKTNLADFGDLLSHAETIGYNWNQAHDILVSDSVCPEYEITQREYWLSDMVNNSYGWSEDSIKIVKSFMEKNKIKEFTLVN